MGQRFEIPTSIDNMKHSDPFLRTLAYADADDGVVAYRSAHIEGVDSETSFGGSTRCNPISPGPKLEDAWSELT